MEGQRSQIGSFLLLAFAIAWLLWLPLILVSKESQVFLSLGGGPALAAMILASRGREWGAANPSRWLIAIGVALVGWFVLMLNSSLQSNAWSGFHFNGWLLVPALIPAWIITGAWSRNAGTRELLDTWVRPRSWRWPAIALLAPILFMLGTGALGTALRFPVVRPLAGAGIGIQLAIIVIRLAQNFLFGTLFEEPGWRGFLLPRLQARFCPLAASLLVWLPWALWHLPLDLSRPVPWTLFTYLQYRVIFLIPFSILLTWIYNRSGSTVLAPALFHAAFNAAPACLPFSPPLAGLIFIWTIAVVITDRMWRRQALPHAVELPAAV